MNVCKINFVMLSIATALIVSACGGGDSDSNSNSNNGSIEDKKDVLVINLFDTKYNPNSQTDGIQRVQWVYKTGDRELIQKDIVDVNIRQGLDNEDAVVLGNNFESVLAKSNIQVDGSIITVPMKGIMSGRTETYSVEFQPIDISGVSRSNAKLTDKSGIHTYLDFYDKIPDNIVFPDNSLCYVEKESSTIPFYSIDINNDSNNFSSLTNWITANVSFDTPIRTEESLVGSSNQYPVARLVYDTDPSKEYSNKNAVNYENVIYNADYVHEGSVSENTDPKKDIVNCSIINNVAADFIEDQIIKYYK